MTQYMLAVHMVEGAPEPSPETVQTMYADVDKVNLRMQEAGAWVFAGGLHPASTATVVQLRNQEIITTDGPFSEAKEQIGGFWVLECPDLDAALAWAREATVACQAPVEVRPFQDEPDA